MPDINLPIVITLIFGVTALNIGLMAKKMVVNYIVLRCPYFTANSLVDSALSKPLSININPIRLYCVRSIGIY